MSKKRNSQGTFCIRMTNSKFLDHPIPGWEGPLDSYDPQRLAEEETRTGGKLPVKLVTCHFLPDLLKEAGFHHIDFMTVDIEGGEAEVILAFPWDEFVVDVVLVEQLIRWDKNVNAKKDAIIEHLESFGYEHVDDIVFNDTMDMVFKRLQKADLKRWNSVIGQGSFSTQSALRKTGRLRKQKSVQEKKPMVQVADDEIIIPDVVEKESIADVEDEVPEPVKRPTTRRTGRKKIRPIA